MNEERIYYKHVAFYSIANSIAIMIFSILLFYLFYQKNNLILVILLFIFAFISNSLFFTHLLKKVEKIGDIREIRKLYTQGVFSATIILMIVAYFIVPRELLFLFFMPLIGIVMARVIAYFYARKYKK